MKAKVKKFSERITPILAVIKKYSAFSFFIVLLCLFGFLVWRINVFNRMEPTNDQVNQKLQAVQRPHIDQATVAKLQQLQDQNIQVQALFEQARNNPFSE